MKEFINGLQHIGIPTQKFDQTVEFYQSLGFENVYQTKNGDADVAFLQIGNLTIETYTGDAAGKSGSIDHIAIDVTDIEKAFEFAKKGSYKLLDKEINFLDFFEKGVRYFTIEGPNSEKVEFNQKL